MDGVLGSMFYFPLMVAQTALWYAAINLLLQWVREHERPVYMRRTLIGLLLLTSIGFSLWRPLLWKTIGAAVVIKLMTTGRGKLRDLTPSLRLKLCSLGSNALCGAVAALGVSGVITSSLWSDAELSRAGNIGPLVLIATALGGFAGLLRKKVRERWPEAFDMGYSAVGGNPSTLGFYMDEVLLPAVLGPILWIALSGFDSTVQRSFSMGIMLYPVIFVISALIYMLWAWFHTGTLGWLGSMNKKQYMAMLAYEVLIWDFHVQRWLGELQITADPHHKRYVLAGALPDRSTLTSIVTRLKDIDGAEVDAAAVRIDPMLEPDYRRLTAILRRGTYAMRRKAHTATGSSNRF